MKNFLLRWLICVIALVIVVRIVPGVSVTDPAAFAVAAVVLGLLNAFVRPVLILLTLPLSVLSLGLFALVINGFLFYVVARLVQGFAVAGFWNAFWAALLFSFVSFLLNQAFGAESAPGLHAGQCGVPPVQPRARVIDVEPEGDTMVQDEKDRLPE